ncbi:MAG: hypothetical protein H7328_06010 [Bdellovibrio sp.]|nr:hypothetical protein [Bdellovibrio sp.]
MIQDNENSGDKKNDSAEETKTKKVHIEFPYSELIRAQIPKAFEVAEKVATDWKNEGDFTAIGLPHPLAEAVASQALQKAKLVEKKLEEKGVFALAKMGFELAKAQIDQIKKKL